MTPRPNLNPPEGDAFSDLDRFDERNAAAFDAALDITDDERLFTLRGGPASRRELAAALVSSFTQTGLPADLFTAIVVLAPAPGDPLTDLPGDAFAFDADGAPIDASDDAPAQAVLTDVDSLFGLIELGVVRAFGLARGVIERWDAAFMQRAFERNESPLAAEIRAESWLAFERDGSITLRTREIQAGLTVTARAFASFVNALTPPSVESAPPPPLWQLGRLLAVAGAFSVRSPEIDAYTTWVDVGVAPMASGAAGPASLTLIYDIPSRSWHDEP